MFKELRKEKVNVVENAINEQWRKQDILKRCIETRDKTFVFYDGPATANGLPGLHHMMAKFLKDVFCKYKTMQGYKVLRKVGWDTHGLPVELQVEKELGFSGKKDIEKYGIKEFNQKCRESVWKNEKAFSDLTVKMGQFIDLEHPYVTYDNNYIETEWWILNKFFKEGLFYEGHKILPYCPRCGTGLASHEVAQGYKEVSVDTVIVPMKKKGEDVYFLVWTTTPWTLISNVGLCVNPEENYIKVKSQGYQFILAEKLASKVLGEEYEVLEIYKGKELEYMEYEQLIPEIEVKGKAFYVTTDSYVTMEDGTGIVHLAPAFGEDDAKVGKRYHLPYLNPVGEDGKYTEGPWKGMLVFDADIEVIKYLKEHDKLFKKIRMVHNYPHCWRCDTPLIYYSKPSFYLEVTKLKDQIIANNKTVNWYPAYVGEKRFANWLENLNDWAISRNRYWGTPLPLWRCECGEDIMIASREELAEKAIEKVDPKTIDLHRPFVDEIHLTCPKCGKKMTRVPDVIDCWFDSGSMPYAQYHYPFENQELFHNQFPADFISEGVDQTRGWFYTLMVLGTFVMGKSPYKNVLVNDLLLDKYGKKMSKSKGNIVSPFETIEKYGADTIRFYLPYTSPVWTPIKFDEEGLKEVYSKYLSTLKNTYSFFCLYANTDKIDPRDYKVDYQELETIDKWILSKYHHLIKSVTASYEEYDLNKVVKALVEFVSEDLSNWYIRRSRKRFWGSEITTNKKAVYQTTYEVLKGVCLLAAPITPFVTEEIYQNLTGEESVHLAYFPKAEEEKIDLELENRMDTVRTLVSLGRKIREEEKIKVRQPLSEVILDGRKQEELEEYTALIQEEKKIKKCVFNQDLSKYMNYEVKPNFKLCGKIFGSRMKDFQEALKTLTNEDIQKLSSGEPIVLMVGDKEEEIQLEMIEIRVSAKEGFSSSSENNQVIVLNTTITEELKQEGYAREWISKIQNRRKEKGLEITDRIVIEYRADEEMEKVLENYQEMIQKETLANAMVKNKALKEETELNDKIIFFDVRKDD